MTCSNAFDQFRDAITNSGLNPPEKINADGKIHRFPTNGRRGDRSGWYLFHSDGIAAGAFGDWRTGEKQTWHAHIDHQLTKEERAEHKRRIADLRKQREAQEQKVHDKARQRAEAFWNAAHAAPDDHPYLRDKGVKSYGLRIDSNGNLIVPATIDGQLHSLQTILANGKKRFLKGGRKKGCCFVIGEEPVSPDDLLCVAEGYATAATIFEASGHTTIVAFDAGNLLPVALALRKRFPTVRLVLCADDDVNTPGNPGISEATEAARAAGGFVARPDFGRDRPDGATDFNDMALHCGLEAVHAAIAKAQAPTMDRGDPTNHGEANSDGGRPNGSPAGESANENTSKTDEEWLQYAASLDPMAYDRERDNIAASLGIRVSTLDAEIEKRWSPPLGQNHGEGQTIVLQEPEPWPSAVGGRKLLSAIQALFQKYVVLPAGAAVMLALWVVHTYLLDATDVSPIVTVTSPEKRCGKTIVLEILQTLVYRPLPSANMTAASTFRTVEKFQPSLLIDEADTFLPDHEEIRGIINSGHRRASAFVVRCTGENNEPRRFSTWCPKAIAAIGKLASTIEDRSIAISMRRKSHKEQVARVRFRILKAEGGDLGRKAARWSNDHVHDLREADPDLPDALNDRAQDCWRPLVAIADAVGGEWPKLARSSALKLMKAGDSSVTVQLLSDIRDIFKRQEADRMSSEELAQELAKLEDRPWPEWKHGKPISKNQLSRLLTKFEIESNTVRFGETTAKGFELKQFTDAFDRYLGPPDGTPSSKGENREEGI